MTRYYIITFIYLFIIINYIVLNKFKYQSWICFQCTSMVSDWTRNSHTKTDETMFNETKITRYTNPRVVQSSAILVSCNSVCAPPICNSIKLSSRNLIFKFHDETGLIKKKKKKVSSVCGPHGLTFETRNPSRLVTFTRWEFFSQTPLIETNFD